MVERRTSRLDMGQLLAAVEDAPPVAAADVVGGLLAEVVGASEVAFLIADLSGRSLIRLGHAGGAATRTQGRETADRVPLAGTPHGRVLTSQAVEVENVDDGCRVFAPVSNRGEAFGVLEVHLPHAPDETCLDDVALAAHALAYIVIANRRFTDLFAWGQRSVPLSLAAEIQHRLLPGAFTCEAGQCTVQGRQLAVPAMSLLWFNTPPGPMACPWALPPAKHSRGPRSPRTAAAVPR